MNPGVSAVGNGICGPGLLGNADSFSDALYIIARRIDSNLPWDRHGRPCEARQL
jgi:hypothetical protein